MLTGGIKESNSGGLVSRKLARLGINTLVLEDKPDDGATDKNLLSTNQIFSADASKFIINDIRGAERHLKLFCRKIIIDTLQVF